MPGNGKICRRLNLGSKLGLVNTEDAGTRLLAEKILEDAQAGERDPVRTMSPIRRPLHAELFKPRRSTSPQRGEVPSIKSSPRHARR
jgi:hypothetical protein